MYFSASFFKISNIAKTKLYTVNTKNHQMPMNIPIAWKGKGSPLQLSGLLHHCYHITKTNRTYILALGIVNFLKKNS